MRVQVSAVEPFEWAG